MSPINTTLQNFRDAAQELGKYCADKNELRIRKGRKTYRLTCEEYILRMVTPGCSEVVIPIAPDATVSEFRQGIAVMIGSR